MMNEPIFVVDGHGVAVNKDSRLFELDNDLCCVFLSVEGGGGHLIIDVPRGEAMTTYATGARFRLVPIGVPPPNVVPDTVLVHDPHSA